MNTKVLLKVTGKPTSVEASENTYIYEKNLRRVVDNAPTKHPMPPNKTSSTRNVLHLVE